MTHPTYKSVCTGATDHAEALRIEFDPSVVSYADLVGELLQKQGFSEKGRLMLFLPPRILLSYSRLHHVESTRR